MASTEKILLFDATIEIDEVLENISKLKKEEEKLKETTKELADTQGKTSVAYIESAAKLKVLSGEVKTQETLLQKTIKTNAEADESYNQLAAQYSINSIKLNEMSKAERENTEEGKRLTAETKEIFNAMKAAKGEVDDMRLNVGNYEGSIKPLRAQIKELTILMQQMELAGKGDSEEFMELAKKAGTLKDAMNATNDQIKTFTSGDKTEQTLKMMKGSFDAVAGGVQAVEGSMQAFGLENKTAEEGIKRLVAIQAIQNGVTAVYEAMQKESAFMLTVNTVKTKALAAAKGIFAFATGGATVALKAFRAALVATGLGAIVVLIGLLVSNWDKLFGSVKKNTEAQIEHNETLQKLFDLQQKISDRRSKYLQKEIENDKEQIELKKQLGASIDDIEKLEEQLALKRVSNAKKVRDDNQQAIKDLEMNRNGVVFYETQIQTLLKKNFKGNLDNDIKLAESNKALYEKKVEAAEKSIESVKQAENDYTTLVFNNEQKKTERIKEANKKRSEEIKEQQSKDFEDRKAAIQLEIEETKKGSEQELQARIKMIEFEKESALKNEQLTQNQKLLIKKNAQIDQFALIDEFIRVDKEKEDAAMQAKFEAKKTADELVIQQAQYVRDAMSIDLQNQLIDFEGNLNEEIALQKKALDVQKQNEIEAASKTGADVQKIEEKYARAKRTLDKARGEATVALAQNITNSISQLAGEGTVAAKAAAVANTTMMTYEAAMGGYKAGVSSPIPFPGNVAAGVVAAGLAVAAGVANVAKILAVPTPGGGGGASITPTTTTQASTQEVTRFSTNPEINSGIVSRGSDIGGENQNQIQVATVIDEVTLKQKAQSNTVKTQTI